MAAGGAGEVTRVDIPSLREVASQGRQTVSGFRSTLDKMEQAMNASESFWEGDAAELYRSVFRREIGALRRAFEEFAEYPNDLDNFADIYEGTEHRAESIAGEVQQAVWAAV